MDIQLSAEVLVLQNFLKLKTFSKCPDLVLAPKKLNSRAMIADISVHYPVLIELRLPNTKMTEPGATDNWGHTFRVGMILLLLQNFSLN